jgi:hypothetical protein
MGKNTEVKNEYITSADLAEQTKIILGAMDDRFGDLKKDINDVRDELYRVRDELKVDINDTRTSIDGYVKAQEDSKQEFVIVKEEMKQVKQVLGQKLGVEIRAF